MARHAFLKNKNGILAWGSVADGLACSPDCRYKCQTARSLAHPKFQCQQGQQRRLLQGIRCFSKAHSHRGSGSGKQVFPIPHLLTHPHTASGARSRTRHWYRGWKHHLCSLERYMIFWQEEGRQQKECSLASPILKIKLEEGRDVFSAPKAGDIVLLVLFTHVLVQIHNC